MRVQMIGDRPVAPDGQHVETWTDGSVHEVSAEHGNSLVRAKWARAFTGPAEQKVVTPKETGDVSLSGGDDTPGEEEPASPDEIQSEEAPSSGRRRGRRR